MSNHDSSSRSKRTVINKKEDTFALLNNIKNARKSGYNYREEYKEENIYDLVDESEYADRKAKRQKENIVEDGSEYFDDGREVFDDSDNEIIPETKKRKKKTQNPNIKRQKSEIKGNSRSITEYISKTPVSKTNIQEKVNFDDLLEEAKNSKTTSKITNVFIKSSQKPKFKIDDAKVVTTKNNLINKKDIKAKKGSEAVKVMAVSSKTKILSTKKTKASPRKQVAPLLEHNISNDDSIESWNEEATTIVVSPPATADNETEFPDIDNEFPDMDIDEVFEPNKGFCPSTVNNETPVVMWDQVEEGNLDTETCDFDIFEDIHDKSVTQVYWIDAYHDPKIPGSVFMFGKTFEESSKSFVNCCIKISGLERRVFFLPKPDCEIGEVYDEMKKIFDQHKIAKFRCKNVTKNYAFQLAEVPDTAEYLQVQYDATNPALPADISGEKFSHVFGCETSILELLILDLKLKGPGWLNFAKLDLSHNKFSACKLNYEVNGISNVTKCNEKLPNPLLTLLSITIKTVVNPKANVSEIVAVGCLVHNQVSLDQPPPTKMFQSHFTILTAPKDSVMPYDITHKLKTVWGSKYNDNVTIAVNERALISNLLAQINKLDPDLIVGHSLFGNQLQMILQRCQQLDIRSWFRLGRLTRTINLPKITGRSTAWLERMATAGRLICDTEFSGRELIKCRSYELTEMIKEILPPKFHNQAVELGDLSQCFLNSSSVKQLIDNTMDETYANIQLMHELQILPLAYQITSICGNLIVRTLSAGKSERNEYLLLHAFTEKEYITPDKYTKAKESKDEIIHDDIDAEAVEVSGKRKPTYLGGLVLEPKKGFYENFILLMDFNSLYPSIIQELNICFTTIDRQEYLNTGNNDIDCPASNIDKLMELAANASTALPGILPTEIRKLVESRRQIKSLLSAPNLSNEKKMQYDIRQKALKITANSMYGCLGFSHSRFQATQLASLITCKGREILQKTKEMVESGSITFKINNVATKLNLEIVYGDTDSIMVNTGLNKMTDYDTVMSFGRKIKEEVNKIYKHIQIDIDGVFRRLLLLKKKKYAALTISKNGKTGKIETKQELKGLDIVRRDWCKMAIEVGHTVVTQILEGELSQDDLVTAVSEYLGAVKGRVNSGSMELDKFVITKGLARNPEMYTSTHTQPHVQVALRHNKSGATKKYRAQDTVEYVICDDGSSLNPVQRAYSPREVLNSKSTLRIDSHYYLSHQLHPVVSRLVDGIEGLSPATVAESLGLDPKGYIKQVAEQEAQEVEDCTMSGANEYKECKPLVVRCLKCSATNELGTSIGAGGRSLWPCASCKVELIRPDNLAFIMNTLTKTIKQYRKMYYRSVYDCQELLCRYRTKNVPVVCGVGMRTSSSSSEWLCPHCGKGVMKAVFSDVELYKQIMSFRNLFIHHRSDPILLEIANHVESFLKRSAYCNMGMSKFASMLKNLVVELR